MQLELMLVKNLFLWLHTRTAVSVDNYCF